MAMWGFLGTFFLGLVAALIASHLQHRSWRHSNFEALRRNEFTEAKQVVQELSRAVDLRLEATRHFALAVARSEEINEHLAAYKAAISEWMRSFSTFKSNIFLYFGRDEMLRFELRVHAMMKEAGDIIARTHRYRHKGLKLSRAHEDEFSAIEFKISLARREAFFQLRELNDRIAAGEYGTVQHFNNIDVGDHSKITHTYLFQRLLGIKSATPRLTYE